MSPVNLEDLDEWTESDDGSDLESDEEGIRDVLGGVIGGPAATIGNLVGGLFGGGSPRRAPLPRMSIPVSGPGVSTATLNTPQGNATLRLPEAVVARAEHDAQVRHFQDSINANTARINTVSKDLEAITTRVGSVVVESQREVAQLRAALTKERRASRAAVIRMRREQSQQNMLNMVISMMTQNQIQSQLSQHTHEIAGSDPNNSAAAPTRWPAVTGPSNSAAGGGSNSMMMPMMMMMMGQSDSGSSDNSMMMPMMMMMTMNGGGNRG